MHQVVDLKKLEHQSASLVWIEVIPCEFLFCHRRLAAAMPEGIKLVTQGGTGRKYRNFCNWALNGPKTHPNLNDDAPRIKKLYLIGPESGLNKYIGTGFKQHF